MPNREEELLQKAVDGIEPSEGAKERMLANIRRKAAMTAEEASVQTEQEAVSKPEEKPERKKTVERIMKYWIPAAAAVIVILLGWGIYRNSIKPPKEDDGTVSAGGEQKDRKAITSLTEQVLTEDAVRSIFGDFPKAPTGASDVKYFRYAEEACGMQFTLNGHRFRLTVMSPDTAGKYYVPGEENELRENWERNENEYTLVNCDNVDMTLWDIVIDGMKK
ncbi:MAG: hypothetical protein J5643_01470 [Lachnospiraceae bacterium]|nr:hypothetical protein [Lachnospiraceae bacterium]